MVEILIKSSISRYLEFKAVVKFLTYLPNGTVQEVRGDDNVVVTVLIGV